MLTLSQGRVLGSLLEKQRTTPDQYPLSLNATMLACNQSSNREPVMGLSEHEVLEVLTEMKTAGFVRFVHPTSGRGVTKYRQVYDEKLMLEPEQAAVLAVLLLRGPQTAGELRTRCERLHGFDSVEGVDRILIGMAAGDTPMVHRLERLPGHSAARWQQLVADEDPALLLSALSHGGGGAPRSGGSEELAALKTRVDELEARLAVLESLLN